MKIAVADIGGTAVKCALYDRGKLLNMQEFPTEAHKGGKDVLERTMHAISAFPDFSAIGISTTGQVNTDRGTIIFANDNLPDYTGTDVRAVFEKRFGVPTAVENDVNAAALGEAHFGAGRGKKDFLMLTFGTGIGGAVITGGRLYTGSSFSAGEFGGIVTHPESMEKGVTFSGCYENYASVSALVREAEKINPQLTNGKLIFKNISVPSVKETVDAWIFEIITGLVSLIHIFNPAAVLLGGGIMSQDDLIDGIRTGIRPYLAGGFGETALMKAALGNQAGMTGAAVSARVYYKETEKSRKPSLL